MSFTPPSLTKAEPDQLYPHDITANTRTATASHDSIASHSDNPILLHIKPITQHSGQSVAAWFKAFFSIVIALSTLGVSITFNYILSEIKEPRFRWRKPVIQTYLSVSWVLFLLALAFAGLASTVLNFFQGHAVRDWDGWDQRRKRVLQGYATVTSLLLYGLIIAAFVVMGLVVSAYSPVVGWVAVGFTGLFGIGGLSCIVIQSPLVLS